MTTHTVSDSFQHTVPGEAQLPYGEKGSVGVMTKEAFVAPAESPEAWVPSFLAATPDADMVAEIERLKQQRDAVILAHYYVAPDVQAVADYVGDSFYLAKLAVELPQSTIVLAGVEFMGESAKLLNPKKTVLLPEPLADCPMAHMVTQSAIDEAREQYGSDLAVVCYVNSTAELKSWSDVCVTSSNAVKICQEIPQHHILFIPDVNLGRYVAEQVPEKHVILHDGYCPCHHYIDLSEVRALKDAYPHAKVLAHPECQEVVLQEADYIGSTKGIIEYAEASDASDFIVVTMMGVLREMELRAQGSNKRFHFTRTAPLCDNMALITLDKVAACLRGDVDEVRVPEQYQAQAQKTLDLMLNYAAR